MTPVLCPTNPFDDKTTARFWSRVDIRGQDECWRWTRSISSAGYGQFLGKWPWVTHRFAYLMCHGPIPDGMDVMHSCDVRSCVNPRHLSVGTRLLNVRDAIGKGRMNKQGEAHHLARLTEDDVKEIRRRAAAGERQTALAVEFGLHHDTVGRIVHRRRWHHVTP